MVVYLFYDPEKEAPGEVLNRYLFEAAISDRAEVNKNVIVLPEKLKFLAE
jgi:hypothetical protein